MPLLSLVKLHLSSLINFGAGIKGKYLDDSIASFNFPLVNEKVVSIGSQSGGGG